MRCSACGQELPPAATHCPFCASPVSAVTSQPQYEADVPLPQHQPFIAPYQPMQPPQNPAAMPQKSPYSAPPQGPFGVQPQQTMQPPAPDAYPPGYPSQAPYIPAGPATPLHKVLAVAIIVMGAFLAVSEILFLLYRFTIGMDAATIKFWWLNLCLAGVVCSAIFMVLSGLKLRQLQEYRRWAGLSALLFGVSGMFDILYDFVFPANTDALALQVASLLSMVLWYGLYAGIMILLWRAPVVWQEQAPTLPSLGAKQPGQMLGNIVLWAGIFWTARQVFVTIRIAASNIQYTGRSGTWTAAIFAAGILALVCGIQLRAGKQAKMCAIISFACFCLYAILIASVYINGAGLEGGKYLLSDMSAVLETFIAPGFMFSFAFFRYKQTPSGAWPQQTF